MKHYYKILIGCLLLSFLVGCSKPEMQLTRKDEVKIDSLFQRQMRVLRPVWDSICIDRYEVSFDRAIDSIMEIELKKIEKIKQGNE